MSRKIYPQVVHTVVPLTTIYVLEDINWSVNVSIVNIGRFKISRPPSITQQLLQDPPFFSGQNFRSPPKITQPHPPPPAPSVNNERSLRWVCTQENTSEKWDISWYVMRERCVTILYYAIENTVSQHDQCNIREAHDARKVGCNTVDYTTFLFSDWLYFLWLGVKLFHLVGYCFFNRL